MNSVYRSNSQVLKLGLVEWPADKVASVGENFGLLDWWFAQMEAIQS
jgi:hypothetical protein